MIIGAVVFLVNAVKKKNVKGEIDIELEENISE